MGAFVFSSSAIVLLGVQLLGRLTNILTTPTWLSSCIDGYVPNSSWWL